MGCYIRVSTHIAGLAAKPKDVLDTLDLTNFGVKLFLYIGVRSVTIKDFATLQVPCSILMKHYLFYYFSFYFVTSFTFY